MLRPSELGTSSRCPLGSLNGSCGGKLRAGFESMADPMEKPVAKLPQKTEKPGRVVRHRARQHLEESEHIVCLESTHGRLDRLPRMPISEGEPVLGSPRGINEVLAGDGEVFGCEAAAEGVAGIHGAGAFVPTVAVGGDFDCGCEGLEGGELEEEVAVGGEGIGEVEGAGFFEEALTDGAGVEHGLAEGDLFDGECLVGIRGALPTGLPEVLADLMHGFSGTRENLGGGIFFQGCLECGQSAFRQPVVGLQKDEPFAPREEGATIHGVVETAVASTVDGQVRKRVGDLERSVGRAAVHDQVLALDPLPHGAAYGVLKGRGGVERGGDDGEKRGGGWGHEI